MQNIEEMINSLKEVFDKGKVKYNKKNEKCYLELKFEGIGISSTNIIELKKYEPKDQIIELNEKYLSLENKYNNLEKNIKKLMINIMKK